jgi:solute carrier family 50 protein (sugar transporter)
MAFFGNSLMWAVYGFIQDETIVMLQNFMSTCLAAYSFYILYLIKQNGAPKLEFKPAFLEPLVWPFVGGWCLLIAIMLMMVRSNMLFATTYGAIAMVVAVIQFASPLIVVKQVLSQGYIGGLIDMPLSILLLFMGVLWTIYGNLISDPNVIIPNFIGSLLGALQVFLAFIIPPTREGWPTCHGKDCCHRTEPASLSAKMWSEERHE